MRTLPHVPGIDAAGRVIESRVPEYQPGDAVLVTGYDLGTAHWGGFAEYVRVPAEWVVPLPVGMSTRASPPAHTWATMAACGPRKCS